MVGILLVKKRSHLAQIVCAWVICALIPGPRAVAEEPIPPSPNKPWAPPRLEEYEHELTNENTRNEPYLATAAIDPEKVYDLPELIDIAERSHPETRVAWENARQAAGVVGLTESAYYPYLAASAAAGFQHAAEPLLTEVASANAATADAVVSAEWLLFDFGGRRAATVEAQEKLMAANVSFNATHQQIVFGVTQRFYDYNIAQQKVMVAESSLSAADTVLQASQARLVTGLTTKTDELQAEQERAQADYDLESARGDLSDAQVALVDSLGILPTTKLQVAGISEKPFAEADEESLDELMDRALAQRPDLVAVLAQVRASRAAVRKARADFYPKISLDGDAGWSKLDVNAYGSPYADNSKPTYAIGLAIELPLFDGWLRASKLRIAESELRSAESELNNSRDTAVREVWKAYTDLKTAVHKQASAAKFLEAAQSAFDASLDSYHQGLATYVDVANAQRNLDSARSVVVDTRAAIFSSSAALAYSVGDLAKPSPSPALIHQEP